MAESILYVVWNVLPVSFVFFTHLRTFKAIKESKSKILEPTEVENEVTVILQTDENDYSCE